MPKFGTDNIIYKDDYCDFLKFNPVVSEYKVRTLRPPLTYPAHNFTKDSETILLSKGERAIVKCTGNCELCSIYPIERRYAFPIIDRVNRRYSILDVNMGVGVYVKLKIQLTKDPIQDFEMIFKYSTYYGYFTMMPIVRELYEDKIINNLSSYWYEDYLGSILNYNDISNVIKHSSNQIKLPNGSLGLGCVKCNVVFPYAEPNQNNGDFICYNCRL
jgi:hypothetical protein